ncbi:MAG: methanogenesis marker 12 protein [ANME-2 cluster archaeon]|nr:methanogenesis marker 12 protein [ANME-2 cluster archaeon]
MFVGIDHGTTHIRFASTDGRVFKLSRLHAAKMAGEDIRNAFLKGLYTSVSEITMMAVTYSMGDGIDMVTPIDRVPDRGIKDRHGAGLHVGGGTLVYDTIKNSGIPALVIPGLHRGNTPDARFNVFSHGASPEKIGIVYHAYRKGYDNMVVSDISSNTVTLAVAQGTLLGALDACIFAPGIHHGPIDLEGIRDVDYGEITANEAFTRAGVVKMAGVKDIEALMAAFSAGDPSAVLALDTAALFAAMEIVSMKLLLREKGIEDPRIFLAGSVSDIKYARDRIKSHVGTGVECLGVWSGALGCARIAEDICGGARDIMGIGVDID